MPDATETWSQLAPPAPVLASGDEWSVFVSHASIDHVWLVNLCDALRNRGHRLFLDRRAVSEPDRVAALSRSQAGLIVWSSSDRDAAPMRQAFDAMSARARGGAFRFVVARPVAAALPAFAAGATVVDCFLYPDGPSGGEALRLLLALVGQPLAAAAETAATEQDVAARAFIAHMKDARGSAERLQALLADDGPWETAAALGCAVAYRLVGLRKYDAALQVIEKVAERFPHAHRPKQVRALALARRGKPTDLGAAQQTLQTLYDLEDRDPETVGIYARTFMDDYNATGNAASLRKSRDLYAEAYGLAPDSYYTGINAAAKSLFLQTEEDLALGRRYAAAVQREIGTEAIPKDYWQSATVAEAHLILGNYEMAATVYKQAVDMEPDDTGSHDSTWKQASRLMAVLRVDREVRARIRAAFKNPPAAPPLDVSQEIRFAIVMYGGVSLAIYINGVAQEFLRLVRATAADPKDRNQPLLSESELKGTERVYRRAAQLLDRERDGVRRAVAPDDPIRARFVVDILSGTSAGGINAMFLAKALANDQSMDRLKQLWVEEGAIERLINDGKSVENLDGLAAEDPPTSLLNGGRMYRKLLDAFDDMDRLKPEVSERSPLADELDLFVTTTDIRGLPVNLRLADDVVEELRHRNVFRFHYSDGFATDAANDFLRENNPFLAYAARCTSSFPFAFPPMRLTDIDGVLEHTPGREADSGLGKDADKWRRFFPAYAPPTSGKQAAPAVYDFTDRAFGDGGYLDNKPFGHATDALRSRRGGVPSQRKLVFIEPSPEHLDLSSGPGNRPNVIENVSAALSLARYETIRDDLDRVRGRNRLVERVGRIIGGMEYDVRIGQTVDTEIRPDFGALDLKDMIALYGIAYGGYHRLKISALTDELAALLSRISEYDDRSDEFVAIRYLVRAWRESRFVAYNTQLGDAPRCKAAAPITRETENQFLARYDLPYRLRRLEFVIAKIDQLSCIDRVTEDLFRQRAAGAMPQSVGDRAAFRAELARLRGELRAIHERLRRGRDELQTRGATNPIAASVAGLAVHQTDLHALLKRGTDHERVDFACALLDDPRRTNALDTLAAKLAGHISKLTIDASELCATLLASSGTNPQLAASALPQSGGNSFAAAAADFVRHYYEFYERYDLISYPVLQSADVGEELDTVDVVRISPEDARSLIDERTSDRRKLAGTKLMNFGAFLDRGWRQNDILWGRMDGAERILSTILPSNEPEMASLLKDAQLEILEEEYGGSDRDRLCQLLVEGLVAQSSPDASEAKLRALATTTLGAQTNQALQATLRAALTRENLLSYFHESYAVNQNLDPKAATQTLARSTRVIGAMLEKLSDEYDVGNSPTLWLSRLARAFWALVEVAVPHSLPNLIVRHWLKLLYLFEGLLIIGGTLFAEGPIQRFGFVTLGVTLSTHLALLTVGDVMRGRRRWLRIAGGILAVPLLVALAVGVYALVNDSVRSYLWTQLLLQLRP
jgi:patatin-related protein